MKTWIDVACLNRPAAVNFAMALHMVVSVSGVRFRVSGSGIYSLERPLVKSKHPDSTIGTFDGNN
jgi:hypothetical protein